MAVLEPLDDGKGDGGGMKMTDKFPTEIEEIKVDGDKAVVTAKGEKDPLHLVKHEGRWYMTVMDQIMGK